LGPAETVDLEVRWPTGKAETFAKVQADHLVTIHEGSGIIKQERFGVGK
jgi:hypothetical protein